MNNRSELSAEEMLSGDGWTPEMCQQAMEDRAVRRFPDRDLTFEVECRGRKVLVRTYEPYV